MLTQYTLGRIAIIAVLIVATPNAYSKPGHPRCRRGSAAGSREYSKSVGRIQRLSRDSKILSAFLINQLDERISRVCIGGIQLTYLGPLAASPRGSRVAGQTSMYLQWSVRVKPQDNEPTSHREEIFSFDVSIDRQVTSVVMLVIDGRRIFINVNDLPAGIAIGDPLLLLGGRSIAGVLLEIEGAKAVTSASCKR